MNELEISAMITHNSSRIGTSHGGICVLNWRVEATGM